MIDLDWLVLFSSHHFPLQINQLYLVNRLASHRNYYSKEIKEIFWFALFSTFVQPMISKAQQQQPHDTINKSSSIFESREYSFFQPLLSLVMMIFIS